jgi:hypothetical protein
MRFISLKLTPALVLLAALSGTAREQAKPAKPANPCVSQCQDACSDVDIKQRGQCVTNCENKCEGKTTQNPFFDPGCFDRTITGTIRCTIERPPVNQHETPFPKLVFAPNDKVQVLADGCVQTGGLGDTWKRYVNPTGPEAAHKYHGMIRIPSGTKDSALVEIKDVVEKTITVTGENVDPSQLFLSLGYEDDNYSDNGYDNHDDGSDDQCKTAGTNYGGPAVVTLMIYRGVTPPPPQSRFDFDVVSGVNDPNGLPYNPLWTWQARPENKGGTPNTNSCHNFSVRHSTLHIPDEFMSPDLHDCTDQTDLSGVDEPLGFNWTICSFGTIPYFGDVFPGHANWFPVTIEGRASWGNHSDSIFSDDDYDFNFYSDDGINGLNVNGRDSLHIEFDSDETIDNFTSDEWSQLHQAVDDWNAAKAALGNNCGGGIGCSSDERANLNATIAHMSTVFNGHTILTGMFGIDNEHEPKAEIHPLYALATLRKDFENTPDDEVWIMFVRNQGDEGFCSSLIWDAGFEDYTFLLPWRDGMSSVEVNWDKTQFIGTDGTSPPTVKALAPPANGAGVYVTFHLGPPVQSTHIFDPGASVPFINGALHLVWSATALTRMPPGTTVQAKSGGITLAQPAVGTQTKATTAAVFAPPKSGKAQTGGSAVNDNESGDVEQMIAASVRQLPADKQKAIASARALPGTKAPTLHPLPPGGPVQVLTQAPPVVRAAKSPHAINGGSAIQKQARDTAQIKALCAASNNAPAGLPTTLCTAPPGTPAPATPPAKPSAAQ